MSNSNISHLNICNVNNYLVDIHIAIIVLKFPSANIDIFKKIVEIMNFQYQGKWKLFQEIVHKNYMTLCLKCVYL